MSNLIVGRDLWLKDNQVRNHAAANVEVIQGLAGRVRILWELASGTVPGDGEAASGRNPQGLVGVDCSGPPWGSAHRHTIASMGGIKPDSATFSSRPSTYFPVTGLTSSRAAQLDWDIWNRPFDPLLSPGVAPLSRGRLLVSAYRSSGAGNPSITIRMWTNGERGDEATEATLAHTAGTTETAYTMADTLFARLRSGPNRIHLHFESDSTSNMVITKLMLYHGVKRSH